MRSVKPQKSTSSTPLTLDYNKAQIISHADGHYHYSAFSGTQEECFINGTLYQYNQLKPGIDLVLEFITSLSQLKIENLEKLNESTWVDNSSAKDNFSNGQTQAYADIALQARNTLKALGKLQGSNTVDFYLVFNTGLIGYNTCIFYLSV